MSLLSILALGFLLGIKHAIEPDHIIAVSTIASRSKKILRSSLAGLFWGIGQCDPQEHGQALNAGNGPHGHLSRPKPEQAGSPAPDLSLPAPEAADHTA
jgi:hypothetical protein